MILFIISLILFLFGLMVVHRSWVYILLRTWRRDMKALVRFARVNYYMMLWEMKNMTVPKIFSTVVNRYPHKIAFYFQDEAWTFKRVDEYTNRVANFFQQEGFKRGDCVALLLESRLEYIFIWLGLSKIGVITALINTNLTSDPLVHSISVAESQAIIFGSEFASTLEEIVPKIENLRKYQFNESKSSSKPLFHGATDLVTCIDGASEDPVDRDIQQGNLKDRMLYIYTSGTTGLPKAAVITHIRCMVVGIAVNSMVKVEDNDCVYNSLPLYHTSGGVLGPSQAILCGTTVAIRKKFSASNFWKDCVKYRCTIAQYIGETCRYLLATGDDTVVKHNVRAIVGNGLKTPIWKPFVKKFGIQEIYEFYGATESNSNLVNIDSTVGAVGFVPFYAKFLYPVTLIKCDESTGEPTKNENGWYTACKAEEPGVLIGKISTRRAVNQFTGYVDKEATEKKILRNVFNKGDMYFNSGDILVYDDFGYFYFKDRTGDTFRWKGENVSTSEVEAVISNIANLSDAVVYGVEVPGTEGKAGMVAIVDPNRTLDLAKLTTALKKNLPAYAQPVFIRLMNEAQLTGTFKLIKRDLVADGYDTDKVKDTIYFFNPKVKQYVVLTKELHQSILDQKIRL